MDITSIYKGTVTYFSPERHFGFLDAEFQESIFFFVDSIQLKDLSKKERKQVKSKFVKGDEVLFKLKPSDKSETAFEAYDLQFIKNEKVAQLYELIDVDKPVSGFLKKIGDEYFVKDKTTYLFIPLMVSKWEENIEEIYEQRINKPVLYTVTSKPLKADNLKAVLCDRVYTDVYHQLNDYKENNVYISAKITGKNKDGYFAIILNDTVTTFIPFDKEGVVPTTYHKWDIVEVKIKSIYDSGVRVQLA